MASLRSSWISSSFYIIQIRAWSRNVNSSHLCLKVSVGIPSASDDLLFFDFLIAWSTLSSVGGFPSSSLTVCCGMEFKTLLSTKESRLRRSWKYSSGFMKVRALLMVDLRVLQASLTVFLCCWLRFISSSLRHWRKRFNLLGCLSPWMLIFHRHCLCCSLRLGASHPRSQGLFPTPPPSLGGRVREKALGTRMRSQFDAHDWADEPVIGPAVVGSDLSLV